MDGFSWLIGIKVAGLKVKLPFITHDPGYVQEEDPYRLTVSITFLYLCIIEIPADSWFIQCGFLPSENLEPQARQEKNPEMEGSQTYAPD